jgi:hypothetical protein
MGGFRRDTVGAIGAGLSRRSQDPGSMNEQSSRLPARGPRGRALFVIPRGAHGEVAHARSLEFKDVITRDVAKSASCTFACSIPIKP